MSKPEMSIEAVQQAYEKLRKEKRNPTLEEVDFLLSSIPFMIAQTRYAQMMNRIVAYFVQASGGELTLDIDAELKDLQPYAIAKVDGQIVLQSKPDETIN